MINKKDLAYYGGKKSIDFPKPHWMWPPKYKEKNQAVLDYYKKEKYNKSGFPEIVEKFETNFKKYIGTKYALSLNSGTSALHAAFFAVGISNGDEVLAPSMTFHATAGPIIQVDGVPVICDCELDTGNIDPDDVEKKITKKTKAIVITHLCGHPCDMKRITRIIKKYNLFLIEDCSHAHGSTYYKKKVGTFGDIGVFSLDNNKLLAAGEGGILVTNKKFLFERALIVSDFGPRIFNQISSKNLRKFVDTGLGYKHRIHPASAAIANCELKKINYYINKRYITLKNFSKRIIKIPGISPPITRKNSTRGAFFGYRIFYNKKLLSNTSIDYFISLLQAEGMEIRKASNKPLQFLPLFTKKYGANFLKKKYLNYRNFNDYSLKNSEYFYNNTLSLPTFTFENKKLVDSYIAAFKKVCNYLKFNKNEKK